LDRLGLGSGGSGAGRAAEAEVCERVGEDAYFRKGDALGIADGVGGWKAKGVPGADAGTSGQTSGGGRGEEDSGREERTRVEVG
jgi:hypothetical protein